MAPHSSISPGESQGRGSLVGCRLWGRTELDTTEVTQQQQQKSYWALRTFKWLEMGIFPASWHLVLVKILDICNFNTVFSFVSVWWLFAGCCVWLLAIHGLQHATLHCLSLSPRVCSNSCPLNQWCHPTISSSVAHFSCPQSFPASWFFSPVRRLFASGGQNLELQLLHQSFQWFPLGLTALISLLSKGLSRVFSNTTVWKHQFFGTQPSLWSNSHIHAWLLEKP